MPEPAETPIAIWVTRIMRTLVELVEVGMKSFFDELMQGLEEVESFLVGKTVGYRFTEHRKTVSEKDSDDSGSADGMAGPSTA